MTRTLPTTRPGSKGLLITVPLGKAMWTHVLLVSKIVQGCKNAVRGRWPFTSDTCPRHLSPFKVSLIKRNFRHTVRMCFLECGRGATGQPAHEEWGMTRATLIQATGEPRMGSRPTNQHIREKRISDLTWDLPPGPVFERTCAATGSPKHTCWDRCGLRVDPSPHCAAANTVPANAKTRLSAVQAPWAVGPSLIIQPGAPAGK